MLPSDIPLSGDALALLASSFRPVTADHHVPGFAWNGGLCVMPGTLLNDGGRQRFLEVLANDFAVDREALQLAIGEIDRDGDEVQQIRDKHKLRPLLTPPRIELVTQFNSLPEGVKFLVDLRADLIPLRGESPALAALDRDMKDLLASRFDVGFLDMRRLTWNTPESLLEKLIR